MALVPKTWKINTNKEISKIYDEAWQEAVNQKCVSGKKPKPELYIFNNKSTSKWGETRWSTLGGSVVIGIDNIFFKDPSSSRETLIHEIAHACLAYDPITMHEAHGPKWESCGNKIGQKYGIKMSRASSIDKIGISANVYPVHIRCTSCKRTMHLKRWTSKYSLSDYKCTSCNTNTLEFYDLKEGD